MKLETLIFRLLFTIIGIFYFSNLFCQKVIPNKYDKSIVLADTNLLYVKHINSIYQNDGAGFLDCIIKYYLDTITDIKYITNRKLLHEIPINKQDTVSVDFKNEYLGNVYEVVLKKQRFQPQKHKLEEQISENDTFRYAYIDNQIAYGSYGSIENTTYEIKNIIVKINNQQIIIPKSQYVNLLTPWFGIYEPFYNSSDIYTGVDVWTSIDGKYLYIYIFGGTGGIDTYSAKLVFSKTKYLKRIVIDYAPLTTYGTFRKDFIGF